MLLSLPEASSGQHRFFGNSASPLSVIEAVAVCATKCDEMEGGEHAGQETSRFTRRFSIAYKVNSVLLRICIFSKMRAR